MGKFLTVISAPVAVLLLLLSFSSSITATVRYDVREGFSACTKPACRRGEVIVMYRTADGAQLSRSPGNGSRLANVLSAMGAKEIRRLSSPTHTNRADKGSAVQRRETAKLDDLLSRISLLSFDTTRVSTEEEAVKMLMALDEVELAEPNLTVSIQPENRYDGLPSGRDTDSRFADFSPTRSTSPLSSQGRGWNVAPEQWYLEAINMPRLWEQPVINAKRPVVAIVDTGVDTTHPDLKDNIAEGGYDFVADTTIIFDANGHGTHCAGIVAAAGHQMAGANPDALILPVTVVDSIGSAGLINIMLGIVHACKNGADIISLSLGTYGSSNLYHSIINTVSELSIVVAAAGNEGFCMHSTHRDLHGMATPHLPCLPAAYETAIGVMATTEEGGLSSWSNFDCNGPLRRVTQPGYEGWGYQLRVPGNHILSTLPGGKYGFMSGTSMATPLAAGAISRLLQCRKFDSREEMVRTLVMTTRGQIDLMAALEATPETLHPGLFTEVVDGLAMTFKETSDSTAQLGDGYMPALLTAQAGESLSVPDEVRGLSVTALAPHALEGCGTIRKVTLGCNIETIGDEAFHDCTQLQELAFATRLPPTAPTTAFDSRHYLTVTLRNAKGYEESYAANFKAEKPWSSFGRWQELEPATGNRFWETIDGRGTRMSFIIYSKEDAIAMVGDGERCIDSLRAGNLTIPATVRGLDVMVVGDEAFSGCTLLTSVTLPKKMVQIWFGSFAGCTGLTDLELPDNVNFIGGRAFNGCDNLRTLRLSKRIATIGNYAFAGCTRLSSIVVPCAEPPTIDENIFLARTPKSTGAYDIDDDDGSIYRQAKLYVPYGCRNLYAKAPGWKNFRHIVELETESITTPEAPDPNPDARVKYDLRGLKTVNSKPQKGVYISGNRKYIK